MRVRQFQQSCVFTSGLLMAALAMDCCICSVSLGQTLSTFRNPGGVKLIEMAAYIDLPSTVLHDEASPSDATKKSLEAKESADSVEEKNSSEKTVDNSTNQEKGEGKPETIAGDAIAPMQNRELTIRVQAVSISHDKIGTGLVPQSGIAPSDQVFLPSGVSRGMQYMQVQWRASHINHFPLYFEDAMLERHGHTRCFLGFECAQSLVSGAKFFGTIPLLPYLKTLRPAHDCVYALGHYRPGSGAPCLRDNIPYDAKAAIVESASAAAFFWAMPL